MDKKRWTEHQIAEIINKAKELGINYQQASDRFGIPTWKIYHYNHARNKQRRSNNNQETIKKHTVTSLSLDSEDTDRKDTNPALSQSITPAKSELPQQVKELIIAYRHKHPFHGFKRIEQQLQNKYFLVIPRKQIRRVLKEAGLLKQHDSSFDREDMAAEKQNRIRRFEADQPCELYQMDITYVYITGLKVLYLINLIDDHSRFCLSSSLRFDQSSDTLIETLHDVIINYGKPQKVLTDQGTAFYSWSCEKTKFQHYLDDQQIEHIVTDPHHPTTTGKVERFHQTIKNELIRKVKFSSYTDAVAQIQAFVHKYNYERAHQALGGACPADRFMGVTVNKAQAKTELLDQRPNTGKGYLVCKFGAHEVTIVHKPDQAPRIFVNGVLYAAKWSQLSSTKSTNGI